MNVPVVVTVLEVPVSLVSTLPVAEGSPANAVLPGLTPASLTGSPVLVSGAAPPGSLAPAMVMVSCAVSVAPRTSLTV